jgi:hypothetical protein
LSFSIMFLRSTLVNENTFAISLLVLSS